MEQNKMMSLYSRFQGDIPDNKKHLLKSKLQNASDECYEVVASVNTTSWILVLLMSIFFGGLGVDRFLVGDVGLGICKLLFGWLTFGIWPLVDIFFSYRKAKERNFQKIFEAIY